MYLETIAVTDPYYEFMGERLIGLKQLELIRQLELLGIEELEIDRTAEETTIIIDDIGVIFWMEEEVLVEIQWGADM